MTLKVLVAEDDNYTVDYLKNTIEKVPDVSVVAVVDNGKDAVKQFEAYRPQVVFLDIKMPEMNGVEAAREIAKVDPDVYFVFVTGYSGYTLEAFELYSFDYIIKPYKEERVIKTVRKIKEKVLGDKFCTSNQRPGLLIKIEERKIFLNPHEIIFIESQGHKIVIKTVKGDFLTIGDLHSLERKLHHHHFFRSHKGYLVNLKYLKEVVSSGRTFEIILRNEERVPLSREREKILRYII